jgi:hypothetical protein
VYSGKRHSREEGHKAQVRAVCFAGSGRLRTTSSGELIEWSLTGREMRRNFLRGKDGKPLGSGYFPLVFSPGGRYLINLGDHAVTLHDVAAGKTIGDPLFRYPDLYTYQFSPDESLVVMAPADQGGKRYEFRLFRSHNGKELPALKRDTGRWLKNCLGVPSPDGRQVAVLVRYDSQTDLRRDPIFLDIYDTATGRRTAERRLAQGCWNWRGGPAAFTPDGQHLLTVGDSREELFLSDMRSGQITHTVRVAGPVCGPFALCPCGRLLAVPHDGDDGPVISVVELSSGQALLVLPVRTDPTALAFSADGRLLASGLASGTTLVWDLFRAAGPEDRARPAELFARLLGEDAAAAWQAVVALRRTPDRAVVLARDHLRTTERTAPGAAKVARLIARLDDDDLRVRQRAQQRLELHRGAALSTLKKALAEKPSPEARRRLRQLLDDPPPLYPRALLPSLRAVGLLELVGTAPAKAVLEEVAGWQGTALAAEAKAALARLKKGGER